MSVLGEEALDACLEAQNWYEALLHETLTRHGRNVVDLGYANAYDGPPPEVREALRASLDTKRPLDLQYTPYGGSTITRRLVARNLSASHATRFRWRDVVLTPGAMAALNIVFRSVRGEPGSGEVVVVTPCWIDYPLYLRNLGLEPRFVPVDAMFRLDLAAIEAAIGPKTRAVIFSQPANPTGAVYSREQLEGLAEVLRAAPQRIMLISDECHRDFVFDDFPFTSPVECYDDTCVIYSFGKKLFMQGQRIGYVAVSPKMEGADAKVEQLEQLCRVMGFSTPTSLMQIAVRSLLDVKADPAPIEARRKLVLSNLDDFGYDVVPSQATFFLYPKTPGGEDRDFARRLAERGVLVLPAPVFHHEGHFRLSLTATDEAIARALPILRDARSGDR